MFNKLFFGSLYFITLLLVLNPIVLAQFTQQGPKLAIPIGPICSAQQGQAVSISANGNTAIVGGPLDNGGKVPGGALIILRGRG